MKKIFTLFAALAMVMSMSAVPYLKGAFNGWGESNSLQSGSTDVTLNANATYEFKVNDGNTWYGNNGTMTSTNCTDWTMSSSAGNCKIKTTIAGVYTFKWNASSKKLSVVYPTEAVEINYYITGSGNLVGGDGWKANEIKMTNNDGTYTYTFTNLAAGNYEMKITQGNWDNTLGFSNLATSYVGVTGNNDNNIIMALADATNLTVTVTGTTVSLSLPEKTNTIYFVNEKGWAKVNAYVWTDNPYKPWPGEAMTKVEGKTYGGKDVYTYTYPANNSKVIFNDGASNQTGDLTYSEATPYYYNEKWNASIAYDKAKYNVNVTAENGTVTGAGEYEEGATATLTANPAEGYEFTCWTSGEDTVSTANPYTFPVTANVALVANFKKAVEEHTITLSGLLKYSNEFRGYTTLQNVEGDTAFFVYNYVDGVPAYGEGYSVTANLGDLTLEGTGSWKLIDELETITAVLYNEERTAVYNVTVSAKAPEVHNLTCTDALYVENISEWMSELTITGVIDEAALKISVYDWQEATAGTYYQVMGVLNDEVYIQPESAEVTIVDTKLTIAFSAVDEFGNTYNVNVTATPKPNTPLVVENATFTVDGDNLTIQGQWETKSVVVALVGWSTTKYGEYNAVLMTGTGEAEDDIYAEFSAVLSKDGTTATLTGVAVNWDGTKYDVTISGLAPAEAPTALDNVDTTVAPVKVIENGQLIIIRNGVQYNAQGAVVK